MIPGLGRDAVQVVTGHCLFTSEAVKVYDNPAFRVKMHDMFGRRAALIFIWTVDLGCGRTGTIAGYGPAGGEGCGFRFVLFGLEWYGRTGFIGFVMIC